MADAPKIFELDPEQIIQELKAGWEARVGKTILPAQPEFQGILSITNREVQLRGLGDYTAAQNLTPFSTAPILDYKAASWGLTRLAPQPAVTKLRFTLVPGHSGVLIPEGTRVASTDGSVTMATDYEVVTTNVALVAEVTATAVVAGLKGNNQNIGAISVIVDAVPFVQKAENLTVTDGGSEQETDEQLRARIILAPSQSSTAGSAASYKFHALSANPRIIDVKVLNGGDGVVNVYPLVEDGNVTPDAILNAVAAKLNDERTRPINDTINVVSPTRLSYNLSITLVLRWGVVQSVAKERVEAALTAYCLASSKKLGNDVTLSQLTAAALKDNMDLIRDIDFAGFSSLAVPPTAFAVPNVISVVSMSYENPNE